MRSYDLFSRTRLGPTRGWPAGLQPRVVPKLMEQQAFGPNPGALRMFAYTPPHIAPQAPLVVILHGCGQSAADYDRGTGWTDLADQLGFAVLAPEQTRSNNPNGCFNWFLAGDTARDHGEAASIRAMIAWMQSHHSIASARIYVTGLSAGGAMAASLLAAYPDMFAGGAVIAGLPAGSASHMLEALKSMQHPPERTARQWGDLVRNSSSHKGPWPAISIWHGNADSVVHADNREAAILQWLDVHELNLSDAKADRIGPHLRRTWHTPGGRPVLEAFDLSQMGHGVPLGGDRLGEAGPYFLDAGISSTAYIASFWGFAVKPASGTVRADAPAARGILKAAPTRIGSAIKGALKSAGLLKV